MHLKVTDQSVRRSGVRQSSQRLVLEVLCFVFTHFRVTLEIQLNLQLRLEDSVVFFAVTHNKQTLEVFLSVGG